MFYWCFLTSVCLADSSYIPSHWWRGEEGGNSGRRDKTAGGHKNASIPQPHQLVCSALPHRPKLMGGYVLNCPSVCPSTKRFFDFNEIWRVGRGRWLMHDGMQYDPIQGQGHEPLKVGNPFILKAISAIYNGSSWALILKLGHTI